MSLLGWYFNMASQQLGKNIDFTFVPVKVCRLEDWKEKKTY